MNSEKILDYLKESINAVILFTGITCLIGFFYELGRFRFYFGGYFHFSPSEIVVLSYKNYLTSGLFFYFKQVLILIVVLNLAFLTFKKIYAYSIRTFKNEDYVYNVLATLCIVISLIILYIRVENFYFFLVIKGILFFITSLNVYFAYKIDVKKNKFYSYAMIALLLTFVIPFSEGKNDIMYSFSNLENGGFTTEYVEIEGYDSSTLLLYADSGTEYIVYDIDKKCIVKLKKSEYGKLNYIQYENLIRDDDFIDEVSSDNKDQIDVYYRMFSNNKTLSLKDLEDVMTEEFYNRSFSYMSEQVFNEYYMNSEDDHRFLSYQFIKEIVRKEETLVFVVEFWEHEKRVRYYQMIEGNIHSRNRCSFKTLYEVTDGYKSLTSK